MIVANGFVGADNEDEHLVKLGQLATDCRAIGLPLMAEMIPATLLQYHFGREARSATAEQIQRDLFLASRTGAEIGADIIKTHYTGEPAGFAKIVRGVPVPIWIAGGPLAQQGDEAFLAMVRQAADAGATGAIIGRNVWQRPSPAEMINLLCEILHRK